MYPIAPMMIKPAATRPAMPIVHWIMLVTKVFAPVTPRQLVLSAATAHSPEKAPALPRRATWMVLTMILASMTMARPVKAWTRVFLPLATLPESPPASKYR